MKKVQLSEDVVYRSFGSETVLLNLKTGQYHGLRGSGGRMLEVLAETGDVEQTAQLIAEEYSQPLPDVERDLEELCESMAARSLLIAEGESDA